MSDSILGNASGMIRAVARPVAIGAATWSLAIALPAQAVQFDFFGVTGTLNTSLETGLQWRMQDRDSRLVGKANLNP